MHIPDHIITNAELDEFEFEDCLCPECGKISEVIWIDDGIGRTEAWGVVKNHVDIICVSRCCHAEVGDDDLIQ